MDWLPEHGRWQRHTGPVHGVYGVFPCALSNQLARQHKATRPKRRTSQLTRGVARHRKVVRVNTLQASVEAQAAAGIQMVVAAGNSGSACSTVSDPPSFYAASYTAGALNTGTDTIAGFSSRGPVTVDGSNRIKPDISAPGTGTRSASNAGDNAYTTASGTSMATPHIAGAMGLLWCALPSLRHQITVSRDALNSHAVFISSTQCGTAGPAK